MRWLSILVWSLVGLVAAAVGCLIGSLIGSFWPQTVIATAAAGAAFGLLLRRRTLALIAAAAAAAVSLVAFFLGTFAVSPLIAWPIAGFTIALVALPQFPSKRAKVGAALSAPILAGAGFVFGAVLVAFAGFGLDDSRWLAKFMLGGAAGFGFLVLAGMRIATRRASR
jgi:hypothetical protein